MATTERRYITQPLEVRAKNESGIPTKIGGIAAVVNQVTDMMWYEEMIMPGAFDNALQTSDIRCLYNHEDEMVLGRTKSGTCKVFVNGDGNLEYECDTDPESPVHQIAARAIMRGDVDQSSFQFVCKTVEWTKSEKYGDMGMRVIKEFEALYDVSPVTFPAYEATEADCRKVVEDRDKEKIEREKIAIDEMEYEKEQLKFYYQTIIK